MVDYETICNVIKKDCPAFTPEELENKSIFLTEYQMSTICEVIKRFTQNDQDYGKTLLKNIFVKRNGRETSGECFEAMVYGWLLEQRIRFLPQPSIKPEQCFKATKKDYEADGQIGIKQPEAIFDVKRYGIGSTHFGTMEEYLSKEFPNYIIQIGGDLACSAEDVGNNLLSKKDQVVDAIWDKIKCANEVSGTVTLPTFRGVEIKFTPRSCKISSIVSSQDYTLWARNNRFYFMSDCSQFCINVPYLIFCPFDNSLDTHLNYSSNRDVAFQLRFLCRRIFVELAHMDNRYIHEFDGKARNNITISAASKKITGIIFLDVTKKNSYNDCRIWAFFNPNADNSLYNFQIDQWFRIPGAYIDTFEFDNY